MKSGRTVNPSHSSIQIEESQKIPKKQKNGARSAIQEAPITGARKKKNQNVAKPKFKLIYSDKEIREDIFKPSIKFNALQSTRNAETREKVPSYFGKNPYNMRLDNKTGKVN